LSLPSTCPVCEHTPIAAEDCKPNKSLRTTIKVFLRTEEKKREALRLKDLKNSPAATPITPVTPVEPAIPATSSELVSSSAPEVKDEALEVVTNEQETTSQADDKLGAIAEENLSPEAQKDIPQPSIEVRVTTRFL
jgi:hypothetical protein